MSADSQQLPERDGQGTAPAQPRQPGIVDCALYSEGKRLRTLSLDEIASALAECSAEDSSRFVWIGVYEPDRALMQRLSVVFDLHELAVEDAFRAHQRTKLEEYDGTVFLALRTARWDEAEDWIDLGETQIFAERSFLVTVRHGSATSYERVRKRCEAQPELFRFGMAFALYAVLDFVVDGYFPIVERLEDRTDELEAELFTGRFDEETSRRIFALRTQISSIKRAMLPLADAFDRMRRPDENRIPARVRPYLRDVHDHALRIADTVEHLREVLGSAVEANFALVSVRQNEITKRLASWAALIALPTLVSGIFGMNFVHLPGLESRFGPPVVLVATVCVCGYLYSRFRAAGWL